MAKDILQFFQGFRDLEVDYSNPNFQALYRDVLKQQTFEDALDYDAWRRNDDERKNQEIKESLEGAFHLVLNVKVDADSDFFPFAYVTNSDRSNDDAKKKAALAIIDARQKDIKYNFSQLLDSLTEDRKNGAVESISFKTTINSDTGKLELDYSEKILVDDAAASKEQIVIIEHCLKDNNSFINILSNEYHNKGLADNLFYNILSFDYDVKSGKKLTQFLLISENSEECYYFTQVRVRALRDIVSIIRTRYINDIAQKNMYESIKSAVAAIMSRNMSHNLGSHYLYYTKTYLEDLAQRSEEKGPDIRGAAKVLGYMQARMDYLATIISNDKYPNGAVNFKSQIYDELTIDDFSKRHFSDSNERNKRTTNFLLSNLILSENFTRTSILKENVLIDEDEVHGKFKSIRLQVKYQRDGYKSYDTFTGNCQKIDFEGEKEIKNELSKLNIALPGGTMSCHAFFNVVENFIRNSAKYLQEDFKPEGLLFTIAIKRSGKIKNAYDFVIYDNKNNANKVLAIVNQQLEELSILDDKGRIEKSSKGLKEMLFSSAWMRSSQYPDESFADIINRIQIEKDPTKKISLISKYGFQFVSVADDGTVHEKRTMRKDNLGIRFTLPEFSFSRSFIVKRSDTDKDIITKALSISSDIVCLGEKRKKPSIAPPYYGYFTRSYFKTDILQSEFEAYLLNSNVISSDQTIAKDVYRFKKILDRRFDEETGGDIDKICLWVGSIRDRKKIPRDKSRIIYFERHLSTKQDGFVPYIDYAYADSISGGNFTITLNSLIEEGISMEDDSSQFKYKSWYDKLYGLKIKESALTRITLIDERLFNNMKSDGVLKEQEYSFKNIRVLNINLESANANKWNIQDILEGNAFRDNNNRTHFLSIHLGLIEKVVKSRWGEKYGKEASIEERVLLFMKDLRDYFRGVSQDVFVSVHSGRGNFSKELEGPLASYPFISLAAIENAFSNSKYLLAQLFYNTVYIGKGIINDN